MSRLYVLSEGTAARRRFPLYLVDATDGITPETGEAAGQPQISKAGGAWGNTTATLTALGNGAYYVELTATELDTLGMIQVRYKSAATAEFNMDGEVLAINIHDTVRLGLTALPNAAAAANGGLPTIGATIPNATAGAAGGIFIAGTNAATAVTTSFTTTFTGNLTGSVDSVTGAVGSVTGAVGSVTGAVGSVTGNVGGNVLGTVSTLTTYTGNTPQTGDSFARIGAAGASLTAVPWNATWDAEVQSEVDDALVVHRLDELLNADSDIDGAAPPTVGSVFHELLTKTAGSFTYDQTTDSLEALRDRGDAAWTTAAGFSTHTAADVWAVATRLLTAGTNIALAKGVGVTGFTDLDAAGVRTAVGLSSANLDTQLTAIDDFLDTEIAAIKAKTDLLPTDPADQSAVEAAILAAWTTTITEAYAADGAAATPAQLLYMLLSALGEFSISGTTLTCKKLDGSTTAMTFTLNDATNPTSRTRAT